MLVLSRKPGQSLVIGGAIRVTIVSVEGGVVKVAIEAPKEIPVHRLEVFQSIAEENSRASKSGLAGADALVRLMGTRTSEPE